MYETPHKISSVENGLHGNAMLLILKSQSAVRYVYFSAQ